MSSGNKPLRVLHVIPSVSPSRGGPSTAIRLTCASLVEAGIDVTVVTTDDDGRSRAEVPLGVPVDEGGVRYRYFRRDSHFYTWSRDLTRWLRGNLVDHDLVHIHALFSYPSVSAARLSLTRGLPYVVRPLGTLGSWSFERNHPLFKRVSLRLFERSIVEGAACIHFTSAREEDEARQLVRVPRAIVLPLGVELPKSMPTHLAKSHLESAFPRLKDRRIVLFLSRIDETKGIDLLLRAMKEIVAAQPRAALVIAGEGPSTLVQSLQHSARELGLEHHVLWTGFADEESKAHLLRAAELLVMPSYSESFGLSAAEAMASGLPVVVSDQVGLHTAVAEHAAGIVVGCRVDDIVDAVRALMDDEEMRAAMGRRGRELVAQRMSPEAIARHLVRLYEELVAESADRRR